MAVNLSVKPGPDAQASAPASIPEYLRTKTDLARALGITYVYLSEALKETDAPVAYPGIGWKVSEVRDHIAKRSLLMPNGVVGSRFSGVGATLEEVAALKTRSLKARSEKEEAQAAFFRNQYLERGAWAAEWITILAELDSSFQRIFENELPQKLEGKSAIEMRNLIRDAYDVWKADLNSRAPQD